MTAVVGTRPEHEPWPPLARHGSAPALVHGDRVLDYAELHDRVVARRDELGSVRRLVLLECANDVETVVGYLAAMTAGHPVLLAPAGGHHADLLATYRPDVVLSGAELTEHHDGTRHDLHPDLALLLSTSGSTGSPKLVRLSRENVVSNAAAIATYLRLSPDDRAATTLPMHYCYGLSVVNSHLRSGASLLLTDDSVVDDALWDDVARHRVTSFAGVPHTFDLLDASGFAARDLSSLRYVTQAGGRLAPDRVRRYARLGREHGFELFVMYGQTEATARMAYLPPQLTESRPECVGVPIPGGSLRIDGEGDVGELVYSGPNVMLGYATTPADLGAGRSVTELRTGDLARRHPDGLLEVVGRRSRFAKVFGLRFDLDRLEARTAEHGVASRAVEHDGRLAVFVRRHLDVGPAYDVLSGCGLPPTGATVHVLERFPVTATGKPDHAALARHASVLAAPRPAEPQRAVTPAVVRDE
ncbi:MAG: AMP-binding protein, partial [Nocardioidaceae bacterium]|nr:AMP-binding protein [Nocardioidaceae bacterium]